MDARLAALVTLLGSLVVGAILAVVIRSLAARLSKGGSTTSQRGIGRLVFFTVALVGVVVALTLLDEEALATVPEQALAFVPRVLGAGVLLAGGLVLAGFVARLLDQTTARATGRSLPMASRAAWWVVVGSALILALGQLGIETLVLVIATTIALATVGLTLSLLTVHAGRDLARSAAHGRYLRRHLATGTRVAGDGFEGVVLEVQAASTLLDLGDGERLLVPNEVLTTRPLRLLA